MRLLEYYGVMCAGRPGAVMGGRKRLLLVRDDRAL